MTLLPEGFAFSQTSLEDYSTCARRFDLRYLQDVRWPALETDPPLRYEGLLERGARFHHMAHQFALGIDGDLLASTIRDPELTLAWQTYRTWTAEHLPTRWHAEITLTAPVGESQILAKFDAIAIIDGRPTIIDWKLGKATRREQLARRWQSRVYPYVLLHAGSWLNGGQSMRAEDIRMIYVFVTTGEAITLGYDAVEAERTQHDLLRVIAEIEQTPNNQFALTPDVRACETCVYRSLCDRGVSAGAFDELADPETAAPEPFSLDLERLDEIAL